MATDLEQIAALEKKLGYSLTVAAGGEPVNHNDMLAELADLGYTDGVQTTVENGQTTVQAGDLTATASTLATALHDLLRQVKALPKTKRPKPWEVSTRTIADDVVRDEDGERVIRALGKGDL